MAAGEISARLGIVQNTISTGAILVVLITMLGKVLPYFVIGFVQVAVILVAAKVLFAVPFFGSFALLMSSILIYVLALVLLGYTFSTFARNQMQAMQPTFFYFLPSILLSGFMFPFRGMPVWAQWLGETLPITHFLRVIRAVMLKGADFKAVAIEMTILAGFVVLFMLTALSRFRRTLD
jgi:ABC-2 type transport system permease protein